MKVLTDALDALPERGADRELGKLVSLDEVLAVVASWDRGDLELAAMPPKLPCPVAAPDGRQCTGIEGHYVKTHSASGFDIIEGHSYRRAS